MQSLNCQLWMWLSTFSHILHDLWWDDWDFKKPFNMDNTDLLFTCHLLLTWSVLGCIKKEAMFLNVPMFVLWNSSKKYFFLKQKKEKLQNMSRTYRETELLIISDIIGTNIQLVPDCDSYPTILHMAFILDFWPEGKLHLPSNNMWFSCLESAISTKEYLEGTHLELLQQACTHIGNEIIIWLRKTFFKWFSPHQTTIYPECLPVSSKFYSFYWGFIQG